MRLIIAIYLNLMGSLLFAQNPEREVYPRFIIGFDSRKPFFVELGGDILFGSPCERGEWFCGYPYHSISLLGGYNFNNKIYTIEAQYAIMPVFLTFASTGLNLNTSIGTSGGTNIGIKPIVGVDIFYARLHFGYNFLISKKIDQNKSAFSISVFMRIPPKLDD